MKKELSKSFNPTDIEKKWYEFWESKGYYKIGEDSNNLNSFSPFYFKNLNLLLFKKLIRFKILNLGGVK